MSPLTKAKKILNSPLRNKKRNPLKLTLRTRVLRVTLRVTQKSKSQKNKKAASHGTPSTIKPLQKKKKKKKHHPTRH